MSDDNVVLVPQSIYDAIKNLVDINFKEVASIVAVVKFLKAHGDKTTAKWIESHQYDYGVGFYHGFVSADDLLSEKIVLLDMFDKPVEQPKSDPRKEWVADASTLPEQPTEQPVAKPKRRLPQ
jgi:hypothetical protein